MADGIVGFVAHTAATRSAIKSVSEEDLLAEDMARVERIDPTWAFDRSVIGARAALQGGIAIDDVVALFGADVAHAAADAHIGAANLVQP